ncbi:molybdopterin molybdotransferase [Rhodovulum imhoffii]|uniref:Molybdopterin molybdenumtransferase n=1 Tax=Rhodovulum imhoffii TaxID=365340 RepID=A0A2T5BQJ0_9RHOB|nr:molybdopterin molybdotransferase MoeA [Rhodovulum imhoffii]MBK5934949.1 molybdopterin molybdenumtransferase MoeA [Rhodovulum imhoffii]PTN01416.1 molybdopterin molybdotransferase [Rhodovulum imhoffii]
MISAEAALETLFALAPLLPVEEVPIEEAGGRVLGRDMAALRTQPPFAASAMDGYAVHRADALPGAVLRVVGESAAGAGYGKPIAPGETVRIFTGAPVPEGAQRVVIQENTTRSGKHVTLTALGDSANIRPAGGDFREGDTLHAPCRLGPAEVALLAAMNHARLPVHRRPEVAVIATGNELVPPGGIPGPDQIIASNGYGLKVLAERAGARVRLLPIAHDTDPALRAAFTQAEGADMIVTIGGASVGEHDIVGQVAGALGLELAFHKVAMRPGKPVMAGRLAGALLLGLPGNPVSALVCAHLFMEPALWAMQGLPGPIPRQSVPLAAPLPANGSRTHYMRARSTPQGVIPFDSQDSSLLTVLSRADVLIERPPDDPPRRIGTAVTCLPLR